MGDQIGLGVGLVLLSGILNGSFALPMKRMPSWRFENVWLVFSISGMVFAPLLFAMATVPQLGQVYHHASWRTLVLVMLFGFGGGTGSMLFGLGISRLGMALGFAIILGLSASLGSLLPLALLHPEQLLSRKGYALEGGMGLVILGILFCAVAGRRRERELPSSPQHASPSNFGVGLAICIVSGILSAMLNFSFVFGRELHQLALSFGVNPSASSNPTWALAVTAGSVSNLGYCAYLLQKNDTWNVFLTWDIPWWNWVGCFLMGALWYGSIIFYGIGATSLGALGGIIGWPVMMAMIIITANFWGAVTGEWVGASRRSYAYSWTGLGVLLLAIYIISLGSRT